MAIHAVIMAGGAGTRFWPASRAKTPKQLLPLGADPVEPLLAATVRRLAPLITPDRVTIATGAALIDATARILPDVPRAQILAEPTPRNTAPCIGWATAAILRRDPEALIAVLPSDHYIPDATGFRAVAERAFEGARTGRITTIGIVPTRPDTGYGYIEVGDALKGDLLTVTRFVEKPNRERAVEFLRGGKHVWNAGMFFFEGRVMMRAIEAHMPELHRGLMEIERAAAASASAEAEVLARVFPTLPSVSIDVGVMEKAGDLLVVKGEFGWNDVGSWESAWELAGKDAEGNALPEGAIAVDARRNFVCDRTTAGKKRVVALVGVEDLVVVETDDSVLVIPRARAQDVRAVVEELKKRGDTGRL
jgi:mannose-1-phosphate guanylyltransferase